MQENERVRKDHARDARGAYVHSYTHTLTQTDRRYKQTVVTQRVSDRRAVAGSKSYGQSVPIATCLAGFYIASDFGQFMSVILQSMSGASIQSNIEIHTKNMTKIHLQSTAQTEFIFLF